MIPHDYTCVRWQTKAQTEAVTFWLYIFFQTVQSSHWSQKWKGRGVRLRKCHVMISRNCIVGKVIELTGLVGRRTAKSLCSATFAIGLFSAGTYWWLSLPTFIFVLWVCWGFFFSITLSSKHFVLCRRLVTAFYAIEHLVRREFYLKVRDVSCHVKYKVLYRSDSLRDTHCWCLIIWQNLTVEIRIWMLNYLCHWCLRPLSRGISKKQPFITVIQDQIFVSSWGQKKKKKNPFLLEAVPKDLA